MGGLLASSLAGAAQGFGEAGTAVGLQQMKEDALRQREESLLRLKSSLDVAAAPALAQAHAAGEITAAKGKPFELSEGQIRQVPGEPGQVVNPRSPVPVTPEAAQLDKSRAAWLDEQVRSSQDERKALSEARAKQALAKAAGPQGIDRKLYNDVTSQIYRDMPKRKDEMGNDISPDQEELSSRQTLGAQILRADPTLSAAEVAQRALSAPLMTRRMATEQAAKEMEKAPKVGAFSWGTEGPRGNIDIGGGKSLSPEEYVKKRADQLIQASKGSLDAWAQSNGISGGGAPANAAPTQAKGAGGIPQAAADKLKANADNPKARADFDAIFGTGAADATLKQAPAAKPAAAVPPVQPRKPGLLGSMMHEPRPSFATNPHAGYGIPAAQDVEKAQLERWLQSQGQ